MNQTIDNSSFIEIENLNGEVETVEVIAKVNSKKDDKTYILFTPDSEIKDEVNVGIGYVYEENGKDNLEIITNHEEINYVYSLINNEYGEDFYE